MSVLLALVLSATPVPAQHAQVLANGKAWGDLYLAYSATRPDTFSAAERRLISHALTRGCEALLPSDAPFAFGLGDRAVVFEATGASLTCFTQAAIATDQRGAAEDALRRGLK